MQTVRPQPGLVLTESVRLEPGEHRCPMGLVVGSSGVQVIAEGCTLVGEGGQGVGLRVDHADGVEVTGLRLRGYRHGVSATHAKNLLLRGLDIGDGPLLGEPLGEADLRRGPDEALPSAILLREVAQAEIDSCTLGRSVAGLLSYYCRRLDVRGCDASRCQAFGFHLFGTRDSLFEGNNADQCGWLPASLDSEDEPCDGGFVLLEGASRNAFRRNQARLCTVGFALAAPAQDGSACEHNLLDRNDLSLAWRSGARAEAAHALHLAGNEARGCEHGFELVGCCEPCLEGNLAVGARSAGIRLERVTQAALDGNLVERCRTGLWASASELVAKTNRFLANDVGAWLEAPDSAHDTQPPCRLEGNEGHGNRVGVWLRGRSVARLTHHRVRASLEADLREDGWVSEPTD